MTELRARLKATSAAFQTRENSVAELREAVHHLRLDLRAGQEKTSAQARMLEEQVGDPFSVLVRVLVFLLLCGYCVADVLMARATCRGPQPPSAGYWFCNVSPSSSRPHYTIVKFLHTERAAQPRTIHIYPATGYSIVQYRTLMVRCAVICFFTLSRCPTTYRSPPIRSSLRMCGTDAATAVRLFVHPSELSLSLQGSGVTRAAGDHKSLGRRVREMRGEGTNGRENGGRKGKSHRRDTVSHLCCHPPLATCAWLGCPRVVYGTNQDKRI